MAFFPSIFLFMFLCLQASQAQSFTITSTPSSPVYIKSGEDLSLDIKHNYTGSKTVGVHWKKNSLNVLRRYITGTLQHYDQRASFKGDGVSLVLKNVALQDNATFEVELTVEGIGDASAKNIKVIVTVPPVAQLDECTKTNEDNEGDDFSCVCKSEVGNPTPNASWIKDNKVIVSGNREATLLITNITEDDAGTYTCKVQSHDLSNEIVVTVKVKPLVAPTNVSFGNKNTAFLSMKFTIICKADGNPDPTYTLSHNDGAPFSIAKGEHIITSVKDKDAGKWECLATNKRGTASGSFNLTVSRKPETTAKPSKSITTSEGGTPTPMVTTASNTTTKTEETPGEPSALGTGEIVGIVIGAIVLIIIVAVIVYFYCKKRGEKDRVRDPDIRPARNAAAGGSPGDENQYESPDRQAGPSRGSTDSGAAAGGGPPVYAQVDKSKKTKKPLASASPALTYAALDQVALQPDSSKMRERPKQETDYAAIDLRKLKGDLV